MGRVVVDIFWAVLRPTLYHEALFSRGCLCHGSCESFFGRWCVEFAFWKMREGVAGLEGHTEMVLGP